MDDVEPDANEALQFVLEGPDGDGFVWLCSPKGREHWCRNLGQWQDAAEIMSEWLGSVEFQEVSSLD